MPIYEHDYFRIRLPSELPLVDVKHDFYRVLIYQANALPQVGFFDPVARAWCVTNRRYPYGSHNIVAWAYIPPLAEVKEIASKMAKFYNKSKSKENQEEDEI